MKRLLSAALAALIASMPMSYSLADATPSAIAEEEPSSTEAPMTATEPYDVTTFLTTAQFAARPRISTYNYLLGDNVCKFAEYCLTVEESECVLITLTFPDELRTALADFSDEDMTSLLRMSMDALESVGFILETGDATTLYDMPCRTFTAYTDTMTYAGWAVMDARQAQFVLATVDETGYDFLNTVKTRRNISFIKDGSRLSYDDVTLSFPYSVSVDGNVAHSENDLTLERAELIQISDYRVLTGFADDDVQHSLLSEYVPEGAQDVSTQALVSRNSMLYAYDDESLDKPIQGRLILMDDCILRMEATFDNAGDAFMDGAYVAAN